MTMSDEKKLDYQVQRWADNKNRALSHKWYAIARIDLLIISISGGGIYIVFELIKYFAENGITQLVPLKIAAVFFTSAIIVNFISQFFGYSANSLDAKYSSIEYRDAIGDEKKNESDLKNLKSKIKKRDFWVDFCNYSSSVLMMIGVLILVIYNFYNL
jgi:hypothetical protein